MSMMEGRISEGFFDGYARQLESGQSWPKSQEVKPNVSCKVGYWKPAEFKFGKEKRVVNRPHGKWAWYTTDASNELAVKCEESIYSGE